MPFILVLSGGSTSWQIRRGSQSIFNAENEIGTAPAAQFWSFKEIMLSVHFYKIKIKKKFRPCFSSLLSFSFNVHGNWQSPSLFSPCSSSFSRPRVNSSSHAAAYFFFSSSIQQQPQLFFSNCSSSCYLLLFLSFFLLLLHWVAAVKFNAFGRPNNGIPCCWFLFFVFLAVRGLPSFSQYLCDSR